MAFGFATLLVGGLVAILDPRIALLLFIPLISVIAIFCNYRIGIVLLALILPFSQSHFLPKFPGFNLVGYLSLATFISFSLHFLLGKGRFIWPPYWLLLLYVLPVGIATAMGISHVQEVPNYLIVTEAFAHDTPARYVKDIFLYPMLTLLWAWMLAHAMRTSARPQRYIWLLCVTSALPALSVLASVAVLGVSGIQVSDMANSPTAVNRGLLSISGFHANEVGLFLATAFGPLLYLAAGSKTVGERLSLFALLGFVTLALVLTFTRGAYVAAGISVIIFLAQGRSSKSVKFLILILLLLIAVAFSEALITRLMVGWTGTASFDARAAAVTASRTEIWRLLWPDVMAHLVQGNGLRSTAWSLAAKAMAIPTHPHNLYIEILLDMGVVGLALMLAFFVRHASLIKKAAGHCQTSSVISAYLKGAYASFIGYLVSGVANWHYSPVAENTLIWAGLGVAFAFSPAMAGSSLGTSKATLRAPMSRCLTRGVSS